jgi:hypothetical protein
VTKNSQLVEQYQYDANGNRTLATSIERGVSGVSASYRALATPATPTMATDA